jgi:hypothetical protein
MVVKPKRLYSCSLDLQRIECLTEMGHELKIVIQVHCNVGHTELHYIPGA